MTQKFYADIATGRFLGSTGGVPPANSVEVPTSPESVLHQTWNGAQWIDNVDRVDKEQRSIDDRTLLAAGEDIALVLVELVDWTLANTAMQLTNFTPRVRQIYLDLKPVVDRVKA